MLFGLDLELIEEPRDEDAWWLLDFSSLDALDSWVY
jgi:hypothetical protein